MQLKYFLNASSPFPPCSKDLRAFLIWTIPGLTTAWRVARANLHQASCLTLASEIITPFRGGGLSHRWGSLRVSQTCYLRLGGNLQMFSCLAARLLEIPWARVTGSLVRLHSETCIIHRRFQVVGTALGQTASENVRFTGNAATAPAWCLRRISVAVGPRYFQRYP